MIVTPERPAPSSTQSGFNAAYVWLVSTVAALGGLLFGYDWVVIGGAKPFFESFFGISRTVMVDGVAKLVTNDKLSGWANSCALVGCLIGALAAGALSDKFGRKRLLVLSALLFTVTSIGNALAPDFAIFVAWRIAGGVAIGLASNLSPMYIAEVAPARLRGRLVALNQLTIVVGILLAQLINYLIARGLPAGATEDYIVNSWYGQTGWRWMFALTAVPAFLFFIGMFFVPESPRWLVKNARADVARRILTRVGGGAYAEGEVRDVQNNLSSVELQRVRFSDLLEPKMLKVLLLGIGLAVFQQWCGINVIFNYAQEIFHQAGYDISDVLKNIAWTGSVNLVFTFVALGTVDRLGRRGLMLFGAASLTVIYTILGFCYHDGVKGLPMLLLVLAAIACYAMSLAPVVWVVISEIFPNRIRGAAMAVAVASLWIACFLLTLTFPFLNKTLGADGTFWLYAAICAAGFIFIWLRLPETKGKSLEQIEKELVN